MKKILVLIVVVVVIVGLWWWGSTRGSLLEEEGKLAAARPGRVALPISASGEAREFQRVEIKVEASGTVVEIPVKEGDIVEPGQLLLRIDQEEEQRNVDRAQASVDQAKESLAIAQIAYEQAAEDETLNVELARAAFDLAQARVEYAEFEYNHYKSLDEKGVSNPIEMWQKLTSFKTSKAELAQARVELKRAEDAGPRTVRSTGREVELAKHRLEAAKFALSDAQRRLRKTKVANNYPKPCRVVRIYVSQGQVVSSAITVVGGGTPLMELADISAMEVEAQVDESDVDEVVRMLAEGHEQRESGTPTTAPGEDGELRYRDEVEVKFDALPEKTFRGRIMDVAHKPRNVAQIITYDVRIRLYDHPEMSSVRLGMQGTVDFAPVSEEGLCVPYEAVERQERGRYLVRMPDPADPRGEPLERQVQTGLTDGKKVIIREGLEPGEEVYTKLPTRIEREEG